MYIIKQEKLHVLVFKAWRNFCNQSFQFIHLTYQEILILYHSKCVPISINFYVLCYIGKNKLLPELILDVEIILIWPGFENEFYASEIKVKYLYFNTFLIDFEISR
jgi:hypothetical protein